MFQSKPIKVILFSLFICFIHASGSAGEVTITCGINENNNQLDITDCSVTPGDVFSQPAKINLLETIRDVNSCERSTSEDGVFSCSTSTFGSFSCKKGEGNVASCTLPGKIDIDCGTLDDGGISCNLMVPEEDGEEVQALVDVVQNMPTKRIAQTIGSVCYAYSGSSDFQRDCGLLLDKTDGSAELLDRITPKAAYLPTTIARQAALAGLRNITQRMNTRRKERVSSAGNLLFQTETGLFSFNQLNEQYGGGASADDVLPGIAETGRLSSFINGVIVLGEMGASNNRFASDFDTLGVTAGLDYRLTYDSLMGIALGYSNAGSEMSGSRGQLDSNGYSMTLYGTFYAPNNFYFDGAISYAGSDYEQERYIKGSLGGSSVDQTASADYFGSQTSLSVGGGYDYNLGAINIGGYGQLVHLVTKVDGYEESVSNPGALGSGLASLTMDSQEQTNLTLNLGAQASYNIDRSWGVFQPMVRIEWINELDDDEQIINGRFTADRVVKKTFSLSGGKIDSSYFNLGLGFTALRPNGNSMFLYYQATAGYENLTENMITAGVRWEI